MFSPKVIDTDAFLDMSPTAQNLYFHLGMRADDDGFITPKRVMRMLGTPEDDLKILIAKGFVIPFKSGVLVITHWKVNNLIRKDWYQSTHYQEEKKQLGVTDNGEYRVVNEMLPDSLTNRSHRLGKVSIGKDRLDNIYVFSKPSLEELKTYCKERKNTVDADTFINFYESKGWMIGKNKMKDWKAAVRTWEKNQKVSYDKPKAEPINRRGHDVWNEPDYMKE